MFYQEDCPLISLVNWSIYSGSQSPSLDNDKRFSVKTYLGRMVTSWPVMDSLRGSVKRPHPFISSQLAAFSLHTFFMWYVIFAILFNTQKEHTFYWHTILNNIFIYIQPFHDWRKARKECCQIMICLFTLHTCPTETDQHSKQDKEIKSSPKCMSIAHAYVLCPSQEVKFYTQPFQLIHY